MGRARGRPGRRRPGRDEALAAALGAPAEGPDGREVARRLEDLADELAALEGADDAGARFAILGHRARPRRRVLLAGRSSAAFIIEPGWESVRLVRLGPSEGPALGNRAHMSLTEVIGAIRRGDAGPGWDVPDDRPADLDPEAMLGALREDPAARDRRLVALAREVAEERERLMEERAALAEERASMAAERSRRRRVRPVPPPAQNGRGAAAAQRGRGRRPAGPRRGRAAGRGRPGLPRPGLALPPRPGGRPPPRHPAAGRGGSPWP